MTTGNQIITKTFKDVIYIPLETVFTSADSIPFVYKKDGSHQVVVLGESNENDVIVEQGLSKGEKLYLTAPVDADKFKMRGEDLIAVVKERRKQKAEEEKRIQNIDPRGGMGPGMTPEQMREFFQNLTPEQREKMRSMRGAGGPGAAGMGQGRPGAAGTVQGRPGAASTGQGRPGAASTDTAARQQVVIRNR